MTVIAVPEAPPIICPSWCVVPVVEHVAELREAEGSVVHWSSDLKSNGRVQASVQAITYPDGSPMPGERTHVWFDDVPTDGLDLQAAERFARELLALVARVRQ